MEYDERLGRYGAVSTALALVSDVRLGALLDRAPVVATGIGGTSALLEIAGTQVFAKRIPLTDLERRPEHLHSTANLFGLPTWCQYGVGAPGFGVWREVAANVMTTNWVLGRDCESFPLMYHWRVLPGPPPQPATAEQRAEIDAAVAYWHDSAAIRERLEANARSSASVVLFLEYLPGNLRDWLTERLAAGDSRSVSGGRAGSTGAAGADADAVEEACRLVERSLRTDVSFFNAGGLHHFDAHFGNILTDGRRLYYADLGLATSPRFELSAAEAEFLDTNASHDGCYAVTQLVNALVTHLVGAATPAERNALIRRYAGGEKPADIPPAAAEIIGRYAPVAVVMNDFYWKLHVESRQTPYPVAEVAAVCAATGFQPVLRSTR